MPVEWFEHTFYSADEITLVYFEGAIVSLMAKLAVETSPGLFRHEILVKFQDADGTTISALVDRDSIESPNVPGHGYLSVLNQKEQSGRALVSLPSDGSRVWVPTSALSQI